MSSLHIHPNLASPFHSSEFCICTQLNGYHIIGHCVNLDWCNVFHILTSHLHLSYCFVSALTPVTVSPKMKQTNKKKVEGTIQKQKGWISERGKETVTLLSSVPNIVSIVDAVGFFFYKLMELLIYKAIFKLCCFLNYFFIGIWNDTWFFCF